MEQLTSLTFCSDFLGNDSLFKLCCYGELHEVRGRSREEVVFKTHIQFFNYLMCC